ncbi:MAG: sigma-54 dependent transcriptional regulator [Desulfopila sp.]|nr:sigma-54 dependent transcriptional regulator [Desulfopila sp.]
MVKSRSASTRILIVDDDAGARESLEAILEDDYSVAAVDSGLKALERLNSEHFDLVLLDVTMPDMDGIETLKRIKKSDKSIDVIMVSAIDRAQEATASIQTGAYDYITKPVDPDTIINVISRAMQKRMLEKEVNYLRSEVSQFSKNRKIIGESACMRELFTMVDKVAATSSNVLITGESGTGKELIAQAIHAQSRRSTKPFVAINCAAIPSELMESELYGHEKGAFTGAQTRSIGKFEYADNGTVFLDEIASLKLELQAKLLRFLQDAEFTRVGGNRTINVDVRIIAATNISLKQLVNEEKFREDLFFRLNVIPIELPPLRKRGGDVALLANYFLDKFNRKLNQNIEGITADAMEVLESYHWPGNIRELENLIERLVVLRAHEKWIDTKDLPFELLFNEKQNHDDKRFDQGLLEARQVFERSYILRALRICSWNQAKTAKMLNIHRNTLLQKIKSLNIHLQGE